MARRTDHAERGGGKVNKCKCDRLPVTNAQIDSVVCSQDGTTASWEITDTDTARLVRGRFYYSARIHHREISTSYRDSILKVEVTA
jgi:hypothetical protein